MNALTIVGAGGNMERTPESVAVVSVWHIPNGAAYDRAVPVQAYFQDLEAARRFQEKYDRPPELATLILLGD